MCILTVLSEIPTAQRDRIRWELPRIPAGFVADRYYSKEYENPQTLIIRRNTDYFDVGNEKCTKQVFPFGVSLWKLERNTSILCFGNGDAGAGSSMTIVLFAYAISLPICDA